MMREEWGTGTPGRGTDDDATTRVAPSKPAAPRAWAAEPAPVPVDVDLDELGSPVPGPDAHEVLPEPRSPFDMAAEAEAVTVATPRVPTSVEALGAAAAANAALHSAGAPTPLGGVPRVDGAVRRPAVDIAPDAPAYVPTFAAPTPAPAATRPAAPEPVTAPVPAVATAPADPPLYRPRVMASSYAADGAPGGAADAEQRGGGEGGDGSSAPSDERPRDRAWPLIVGGLVILALVLGGVAWLLLRPEPVEIPAQQVVTSPPARAVEPITPENPTPFLAAMPLTAGMWALVDVQTPDAAKDALMPGRIAEVQVLTYSDGADEITLTARQLYHDKDALSVLRSQAGKDATLTDATVGSTVVGKRAEADTADGATILWTDGSVYLEATGPADALPGFVEDLGL
ncbi:hypothetical protein [Demequina soli]|uniref:hypothetical protein n=1 Tax=Demequina soli TaxID=1638987 RepID=UPI0007818293|nr:hypothetical protein [Demequina soli]